MVQVTVGIHNTLRQGMAVTLGDVNAVTAGG
jgi:hypothetical protein